MPDSRRDDPRLELLRPWLVAIPAVWLYNLFLNKIERFQVEMSNSASELIDYFMKRHAAKAA